MNAFAAARGAGVGRLLYTSFTNPTASSLFPFAQVHEASEIPARKWDFAARSCATATMQRTSKPRCPLHATAVLALPGAWEKSRTSPAPTSRPQPPGRSRRDVARKPRSGNAALDLFEVAELASQAWGMPVIARDMPAAEYARLLIERDLPGFVVDAQVGIRLAAGAGEYAGVTRDAEQLAGHPSMTS